MVGLWRAEVSVRRVGYIKERDSKKCRLKDCIKKTTEITCQMPEAFHFNDFELRDGELYYKDKSMSLTTGGKI